MIRKIQGNEYLKRYDNMTAQEREEYESRVGDWLSVDGQSLTKKGELFEARLQNVLQVSVGWNDQECQAFEKGARLLSALVPTADTWLPDMMYVKSAKRAIKQMFTLLWSVDAGVRMQAGAAKEAPMQPAQPFQAGAGDGAVGSGNHEGEGQTALGEHSETLATAGTQEDVRSKKEEGMLQTSSIEHQPSSITPARPKHIDQYVHLLPQKTQEHAALVQGLYREMEEARQKLQLLMNETTASSADREVWAKRATKCDNTLRKIFDELDAEWAKLVKQGRVVVDDLGNARVMSDVGSMKSEEKPQPSALSPQPSEITSEQRARRRELRKWLIDTRRGNGATRDERVKQWHENFREYLTLEGDAAFEDEKIKEAIEHYGIDVEKLKGGTVMTSQETEEE